MFKKLFVFVLLLFVLPTYAGDLKSFDAILKAVESNKQIKFVTHFDQCTPKHSISMTGMLAPHAIFIVGDNLFVSDYHFTVRNIDGNKGPEKSIQEYVRYALARSGEMNLNVMMFDAHTGAELKKLYSSCQLGDGFKVYAS